MTNEAFIYAFHLHAYALEMKYTSNEIRNDLVLGLLLRK